NRNYNFVNGFQSIRYSNNSLAGVCFNTYDCNTMLYNANIGVRDHLTVTQQGLYCDLEPVLNNDLIYYISIVASCLIGITTLCSIVQRLALPTGLMLRVLTSAMSGFLVIPFGGAITAILLTQYYDPKICHSMEMVAILVLIYIAR